jgi:hypothetical protein
LSVELPAKLLPVPSPKSGEKVRPGEVLVDLPAHAGRLQYFGKRIEDEVRVVDAEAIVGNRPGAEAVGAPAAQVVHVADAARPQVHAIRIGRPHDGAEVGVPDGEGIRQSIVIGEVIARHVRHGHRTLLDRPVVILTLIPGGMGARPTMIRSGKIAETQARQTRADTVGIHTERRDHIRSIRRPTQGAVVRRNRESRRHISRARRLQEDRDWGGAVAALQGEMDAYRAWIGEAAHPSKRAEMMVERAVFLHQDDDVLDILNAACSLVCRNRERLSNVCLQGRQGRYRARAHQLQECTPIDMHKVTPVFLKMVGLREWPWRATAGRYACS